MLLCFVFNAHEEPSAKHCLFSLHLTVPLFHSLPVFRSDMPSFSSLFVALVAASLVTASPFLRLVLRRLHCQSIGPEAISGWSCCTENAPVKYGAAVPADVAAAAAQGSVAATPEQYDSEYLCPVGIGGQTLNLDFDIGSADLYVFMSRLIKQNTDNMSS